MQAPKRHPGRDPSLDELDVANAVETILRVTGAWDEPPELDVRKTPMRVSRMYLRELLKAYRPLEETRLREGFTTFPTSGPQEMMTLGPIPFTSLCAHHLLPFAGSGYVGYLPNRRLVGLSKIPRVILHYAAKLQMQERLTSEITSFLQEMLKPRALIVLLDARHYCMECRGVKVAGVSTKTSAVRGLALTRPDVRSEFYRLLGVGH